MYILFTFPLLIISYGRIVLGNDEKNSENIESDDLKLSTTSSVIVISSSEGESLNADLSKGIFTASAGRSVNMRQGFRLIRF